MTAPYGAVPQPNDTHYDRGYGGGDGNTTGATDFAQGNPADSSPLGQSLGQQSFGGHFHEDFDASRRGSSVVDDSPAVRRSNSTASTAVNNNNTPARSNTLKKRSSVRRTGSLRRSGSRKSLKAGSIKGLSLGDDDGDFNNIFNTPIPTSGSPTEVLADRFQAWRQLLKSLIAYFREIQSSYEIRAKALYKLQNTVSNITNPSVFASQNGLGEATRILSEYHKQSITEANKSREIEDDVIAALTGLRSDLGQKIKEIKSLSGDFKNSVEKEKETTRREVEKYQAALHQAEHDDGSATGKNDPFVVRLGVDRLVERQIDEENYLHRAYLNLESSGRELESIVVGEIQKAYKALAGILRREGDDAYNVVENLRSGPISMPKDQDWKQFVSSDAHFVAPNTPLRRIEDVQYPGKDNPAAAEIRAGMLERKSKYLKSYTPGWYVLSPTHLHEFKSADKIYTQPPVMSLYLADQRLGSRSEPGSSSHKFMLKGRQTGGMHKGHNWVFRAESHDTMLAWFNDIKVLTEKSAEERNAFVRKHTRSVSGASDRPRSISSDGLDDDDADAVPYSADVSSLTEQNPVESRPQRPQPGGRFPSELQVPRNMPLSPSSDSSGFDRNESNTNATATTTAPESLSSPAEAYQRSGENPYRLEGVPTGTRSVVSGVPYDDDQERYMSSGAPHAAAQPADSAQTHFAAAPPQEDSHKYRSPTTTQPESSFLGHEPVAAAPDTTSTNANSEWIVPAAAGAGIGASAGALAAEAHNKQKNKQTEPEAFSSGDAAGTQPSIVTGQAIASPANAESLTGAGHDTDKIAIASTHVAETPTPAAIPAAIPADFPAAVSTPDPHIADETSKAGVSDTANPTDVVATTSLANPGWTSNGALGGLEREGAHETGQLFPKVVRHDTNISVSRLHVPGEFPDKKP